MNISFQKLLKAFAALFIVSIIGFVIYSNIAYQVGGKQFTVGRLISFDPHGGRGGSLEYRYMVDGKEYLGVNTPPVLKLHPYIKKGQYWPVSFVAKRPKQSRMIFKKKNSLDESYYGKVYNLSLIHI